MDLSTSFCIGENTFLAIEDCEAKVRCALSKICSDQVPKLQNNIEKESEHNLLETKVKSKPSEALAETDGQSNSPTEIVHLHTHRNETDEHQTNTNFPFHQIENGESNNSPEKNVIHESHDSTSIQSSERKQTDASIVESVINSSSSKEIQPKRNAPIETSLTYLRTWGFTDLVIEEYRRRGISQMFDWQAECLQSLAQNKNELRNLVYNAPTSAGKTFVSEVLMIRNILERRKKSIIILPFISVVREKMYYLQDLLRSSGIRVDAFYGGYSPPGGFESIDIAILTIEKANSIINRLLEQKKMDTVGLIVVDEIHLISDPGRGYILELLLAKAQYYSWKFSCRIQIVAMTATLPNAHLLTKWLNAQYFQTDFRPIPLNEMMKIGTDIYDNKMNLVRSIHTKNDDSAGQNDQENVGQLCIETIADGSAVIVFCPSKDWCENLALHVAEMIYKLCKIDNLFGKNLRTKINMQQIEDLKTHLKNSAVGVDSILKKTISYGVAFHHAGLTFDERDIIENGFKNGSLKVIVATSTLSSGVNLPARRVIIRSPLFGGSQMNALTYRQMIGRAGRYGKDTIGESILICSGSNVNIGKELINAQLNPLKSCLEMDNCCHLRRAILEIIASSVAQTENDLQYFSECTLFHLERQLDEQADGNDGPANMNVDAIMNSIAFLDKYEFIRTHVDDVKEEKTFVATRLGYACLASSMAPSEGFELFSELQKARRNFVLDSDLHAVYLVTPFSVCSQISDIDWFIFFNVWEKMSKSMQRVGEIVGVKESFLVRAMRGGARIDEKSARIYKRFYASLALKELIDEVPISTVATKYKINRGVLQCLQQSSSLFAGMVSSFCNALNWELLGLLISQFKERLYFGVHTDLLDLMKIPMINGQRARALFKAGFHTLVDLSNANSLSVEKCLYDSIDFDTKKHDGETKYDEVERNKLRLVFITGKSGLTVPESAKMIIEEARSYLQVEMGVAGVVWKNGNEITPPEQMEIDPERQSIENSVMAEAPRIEKKILLAKTDLDTESSMRPIPKESSVGVGIEPKIVQMDDNNNNNNILTLNKSLQSLAINDTITDSAQYQMKVIDVFQNIEFYRLFCEKFHVFAEGSLSVLIDSTHSHEGKAFNCMLDRKYVHGVFLCLGNDIVFYFNLQNSGQNGLNTDEKISFIRKILTRNDFKLKIFDARFVLKLLMNYATVSHCTNFEDPKIAEWLLESNEETDTFKLISRYVPDFLPVLRSISDGDQRTKLRQAIEAVTAVKILPMQLRTLRKSRDGTPKAFNEMEMKIQNSLLQMELCGMSIDSNAVMTLSSDIAEAIRRVEEKMYRLTGKHLNVKSKSEIAKALKLETVSTRRSELEKSPHPIAKLVLDHRKLAYILSNIIHPLLRNIRENRIHGHSISFTATGRISMREPNLQNIPKDFSVDSLEEDVPEISCRKSFAVPHGRELISADFCQLELRILAHLSEDKSLISIFESSGDIFVSIASKWKCITETEVSEVIRNEVKKICYGIIYGMGLKALADSLKMDENDASILLESFHNTYPGIRNYTNKIVNIARRRGFVESITGRRRYLPFINSNDPAKRSQNERQAINTSIQGSAADVVKYAILRMERNILKYEKSLNVNVPGEATSHVNLVLHLHDELIYEVPLAKDKQLMKILKMSMENCAKLSVPLKVKTKKGVNWGCMTYVV